jgi:hypothetical protein
MGNDASPDVSNASTFDLLSSKLNVKNLSQFLTKARCTLTDMILLLTEEKPGPGALNLVLNKLNEDKIKTLKSWNPVLKDNLDFDTWKQSPSPHDLHTAVAICMAKECSLLVFEISSKFDKINKIANGVMKAFLLGPRMDTSLAIVLLHDKDTNTSAYVALKHPHGNHIPTENAKRLE